jgi:hypothetical protein
MSDVTRYRVPISGTHPISGHPSHVTDIVNHIPDTSIGINIGYNIGCPDIGDMISSRHRCQYRVPISGVPGQISGYDSLSQRYRNQYRTRYRVLFLVTVFHADDDSEAPQAVQSRPCCHAGHPLLQCHSCPEGSQFSCAGCTGEEWSGSSYLLGTRGSVELCPPYWLLEPHTGKGLAWAHTTWSPQHAPSARGWTVSAPQRC